MPIQVFGCKQCSCRFERLVSVGEATTALCPVCGASVSRTPACVAYPEHKSAKKNPDLVRARAVTSLR
ncbi:MAG: zinc ribbon domain-containing protein [Thermodesulfobacteriota bacterium]